MITEMIAQLFKKKFKFRKFSFSLKIEMNIESLIYTCGTNNYKNDFINTNKWRKKINGSKESKNIMATIYKRIVDIYR